MRKLKTIRNLLSIRHTVKMLEPRVYFEQFCHLTRAAQSINASEK